MGHDQPGGASGQASDIPNRANEIIRIQRRTYRSPCKI